MSNTHKGLATHRSNALQPLACAGLGRRKSCIHGTELRLSDSQVFVRVDGRAMNTNFVVDVVACGAAGVAHVAT